MIETIKWQDNKVYLLDQRILPNKEEYIICESYHDAAEAIYNLTVRGAPLIGVTAAMGFALGAINIQTSDRAQFIAELEKIEKVLADTRPTAKNLFWALQKMMSVVRNAEDQSLDTLKELLVKEAQAIMDDDNERNKKIGQWGAELFDDGDRVLTHCNAGALATAGPFGTALSPIRSAIGQGKKISVLADETRPVLQGARLTAWELLHDDIPVTVITDNSAGFLMAKGMIDKIIVGADRIAANGDVANKIGTYTVAVMAKNHNIPFYVAAPLSTFDFALKNGDQIPIEERQGEEIRCIQDHYITPKKVNVLNFAFDVTPAHYISALISEKGIARPPFEVSLAPWQTTA
ncbi:S-methyl-5-thioribose-1-phosphate isomerase [candidate division CSSED10-310 bacterium]|uniref:Methylthioribose-1-phosphate isomerase n=1 Tax=candidate division CSSED10-310 bacterium TaxID=2855610 RepID=A0ABV6Z431_UNCC1